MFGILREIRSGTKLYKTSDLCDRKDEGSEIKIVRTYDAPVRCERLAVRTMFE